MTKEEYRKHLGEVVMAVFAAEDSLRDSEPGMIERLRRGEVSAEGYCLAVADEMLGRMSEGDLGKVLEDENSLDENENENENENRLDENENEDENEDLPLA